MWISKKQYDELAKKVKELNAELKSLSERPQVVSMERNGIKARIVIHMNGKDHYFDTIPYIPGDKE